MDYSKERDEAVRAGRRALESLEIAREELGGARGFGVWDLLGGRSWISLFKHVKIERARGAIDRARYDLEAFDRELSDISVNLDVNISDVLTLFDFLDSFIADVMVQTRLVDACHRLDEAIYKVRQVLNKI